MKVTYKPTDPSDSDVVTAFGRVFKAGEAVEVADEAQAKKLGANPQFVLAGEKGEPEDKTRAQDDQRVAKELDGRTREARLAREKAQAAETELRAKERAAQTVRSISDERSRVANPSLPTEGSPGDGL